jgi:hypothetical protein
MASNDDPLDYTEKYNTELSSAQENQYQAWTADQSEKTGRNVGNDTYDYDLRGWFAKNGPQDLTGAHLTDEWKKPNHPTFSTFSQYHGVDGNEGGEWEQQPDKTWNFTPGKTNMQNFSSNEMQDYFKRVEPGNQLNLPAKFSEGPVGAYPGQAGQPTTEDARRWGYGAGGFDKMQTSQSIDDRRGEGPFTAARRTLQMASPGKEDEQRAKLEPIPADSEAPYSNALERAEHERTVQAQQAEHSKQIKAQMDARFDRMNKWFDQYKKKPTKQLKASLDRYYNDMKSMGEKARAPWD